MNLSNVKQLLNDFDKNVEYKRYIREQLHKSIDDKNLNAIISYYYILEAYEEKLIVQECQINEYCQNN